MKHTRLLLPSSLAGLFLFWGAASCSAQPLSGWTSGSPLDRRPIVPVTAYSSSTWVPGTYGTEASPIFMTSLNYPGIYGAYSFADGAREPNREPKFYPHRDPRSYIPATTITVEPFRTATTPAGAATMYAAEPSVTPVIPGGNRTLVTTFPPQLPAVGPAASENTARIVVRLPEDALLEVQGILMPGSNRVRKYTTPPLLRNQVYHYDLRANWMEEGREVVQERHVQLYAGDHLDIDFFAPAVAEPRENKLQTRPLPPIPTTPPLRPTMVPRGG